MTADPCKAAFVVELHIEDLRILFVDVMRKRNLQASPGWIACWVGMLSVSPVVDQMFQLVGHHVISKEI